MLKSNVVILVACFTIISIHFLLVERKGVVFFVKVALLVEATIFCSNLFDLFRHNFAG